MTLKDISNGPEWVLWATFGLFLIFTIILLTGHGANLIAGYNTARKERKAKYDEKKLSRTVGIGLLPITLLLLAMALWQAVLPAWFSYVFTGITLADCLLMMVVANTICRK